MLFRIRLELFCGLFCLLAGFSRSDGLTPLPPVCVHGLYGDLIVAYTLLEDESSMF